MSPRTDWRRDNVKNDPLGNIRYGRVAREKFVFFTYDAGKEYPLRVESVGVSYPDKQYFIERTHADYYTFEYVVSGKGYVRTEGKNYTVEEDCVYILHPGEGYRYGADKNEPYEKIWINFFSGVVTDVIAAYGLSESIVFPHSGCKKYFDELVEIAQEYPDNDRSYLRCSDVIFRIIFALAESAGKEGVSALANLVKEALDSAIYRKVTVEDIAVQINISKSQMTREFRKYYGMSPYQYLLERKIYVAKHLLRATHMRVREIGSRLGFDDEYYFSNLFKSKVGVSPLAYRKNPTE